MSSIPTSPVSPSRSRRSIRLSSFEILDDVSASPYTSGFTNGTTFSRRTSQTSFLQSPITPRPPSARSSRPSSLYHRRKSSSRLSRGSNLSIGASENGLGNLADELEYALEDEYEVNESGFLDDLREANMEMPGSSPQSPQGKDSTYEDGPILYPLSPALSNRSFRSNPQSPSKSRSERRKTRHRRNESKYEGTDHRPGSDQDEDGFTPTLAKRMGDIESLARMTVNTEDTLSEGGGVVKRTTDALKDLGSQAGLETNLSRVIAAYSAMATHRTHKTRDLFSQAQSLIYGHVSELSDDVVDSVLSELDSLSSTIAVLQQNPLLSLQTLASQTLDLAHTLRSLTDGLQESRIQANIATRKLKSVKDMVEDICIEQELTETSMMLIQAGDWDRRCRERQAAATCREVILGFGNRWGLEVDDRPWTREHDGMVS